MVNNHSVWLMQNLVCPNPLSDANRRIRGGPVYNFDEVIRWVETHGISVINESADEDMELEFAPPMDEDELTHVLYAIHQRHEDLYHNSEWCKTSVGMSLACDAYTIKWNRNRKEEWEYGAKLYIKFGFRPNLGPCLIVRIHPAKY